jgi:hypothetical protein
LDEAVRRDVSNHHLTVAIANKILDRINEGPGNGRRYSPAPQAADRKAWAVVQEGCPTLSEEQAKRVIAKWLDTGVLALKTPRFLHRPKLRRCQLGRNPLG